MLYENCQHIFGRLLNLFGVGGTESGNNQTIDPILVDNHEESDDLLPCGGISEGPPYADPDRIFNNYDDDHDDEITGIWKYCFWVLREIGTPGAHPPYDGIGGINLYLDFFELISTMIMSNQLTD